VKDERTSDDLELLMSTRLGAVSKTLSNI